MNPLLVKIDHIGILAPTIESLVREFRALGFSIVGPAELTTVDEWGESVGLGQSSAHVMFADDYIELTAVESPSKDHHLARFLRPPWGIRLLLLATDDIVETRRYCQRQDLRPSDVQIAGRELSYKQGAAAQFKWFGLPAADWPDVLVAYVQHLTKELVFDKAVSEHANGATAISRLYYCGRESSTRYREIISNGRHRIEFVADNQEEEVLGFKPGQCTPFSGVGVAVADLSETSALLRESGIRTRMTTNGVSVQLRSGVCVVFEQGKSGH